VSATLSTGVSHLAQGRRPPVWDVKIYSMADIRAPPPVGPLPQSVMMQVYTLPSARSGLMAVRFPNTSNDILLIKACRFSNIMFKFGRYF